MRFHRPLAAVIPTLTAAFTAAQPPLPLEVHMSLLCDEHQEQVDPGQPIRWSIYISVSNEGRNEGLAGVTCDLVMFNYPGTYEAHPILPSGVPTGMERFSLPMGVSNGPPPGSSAATGYGGVPLQVIYPVFGYRTPALVEIGGAQNTFGVPIGSSIGTEHVCMPGIGQAPAAQLVASGEFPAPSFLGAYHFQLLRPLVSLFTHVGEPGEVSMVFNMPELEILSRMQNAMSFQVICRADINNDGIVSPQDLFDFLAFYFSGSIERADINGDGSVTIQDMFDYLGLYFVGCN